MPGPRVEGRDSGSITCISEGSRTVRVRRRRGVNRLGGAPETRRECSAEVVPRPQMMSGESDHLCPGVAPAVPCAKRMIPLESPGAGNRHAGFGEQGLET